MICWCTVAMLRAEKFLLKLLQRCPAVLCPEIMIASQTFPEEIEIAGKKFLVTHGHYYGVSMDETGVVDEARSHNCDGVMFGHTHKPVLEMVDGILAINPGSLSYPRQRGKRPSYVVLEAGEDGNITGEIKYL